MRNPRANVRRYNPNTEDLLTGKGNKEGDAISDSTIDHGSLSGLSDDDHAQYALLAGRNGGQTIKGGTASANNLTLQSTNHATKGKIILGSASAYDEVNDRLGVGTTTPACALEIISEARLGFIATVRGSTSSGGNLTLSSTSHATKGKIILGSASAYDEVNDRLGLGTTTPGSKLDVAGSLQCDSITNDTGLAAGTYTPTRSAESNLDANVTMTEAQYMRVGNTVTVSGRFTADPTTTLTTTSFEITLPVASDIGAAEDVAGVAFCGAIAAQGAEIIGVAANNTAKVQWKAADVTSQTWSYTFTYQVI